MASFTERFDSFAGKIVNYAVFTSIILATSYIVFPDLRRFVELNITKRGAWYYMGVLKPEAGRWGIYPGQDGKEIRNFYSTNWKTEPGMLDLDTVKTVQGNIVVISEHEKMVVGRRAEAWWGGDNAKSNNQIVSIVNENDCLYVQQIHAIDPFKEKNRTVYLWMYAKKVTCD